MAQSNFSSSRPLTFKEKHDRVLMEQNARNNNLAERQKVLLEQKQQDEKNAELNKIDKEAEDKKKKEATFESFRQERVESARKNGLISLESRLYRDGVRMLWNKVLFETSINACWIDEDIKPGIIQEAYNTFKSTMGFVESVCGSSKAIIPNRLLESMNDVITETAKIAAHRITMEAVKDPSSDPNSIKFDLTEDEESKMDEDMSDLGSDEIVKMVKDKVLNVVQDEKDAAKKKSDEIKDIEDSDSDDEDDDDDVEDSDEDDDDSDSDDDDEKDKKKKSSKKDDSDDDEDDEDDDRDDDEKDKKKKSSKEDDDPVEESIVLTSQVPDDFYDLICGMYTKMYNKSKGNNSDNATMKFTKANRVNILDKKMVKATGKSSFSRVIDLDYKEATNIVKACGFKEGTAKFMGIGRYFIKKLKAGYCELQLAEGYKAELSGSGVEVGNAHGSSGRSAVYVGNTVSNRYLKQTQVTVWYRSKATKSITNRYAIENDIVCGKTPGLILLEQRQTEARIRKLNNRTGESVFESLLMFDRIGAQNDAVLEGVSVTTEYLQNAALLEAVLQYTILETLNTMGAYNFTTSDNMAMRKALMEDMKVLSMSAGKDGGRKKTRIGTMKYKRNNDKKAVSKDNQTDLV